MNRILMMAAAVGDHLREFAEIDLREDSEALCDKPYVPKPYFPKLYLHGRKDKALMTMPGAGRALVRYKVQRRNIDETYEDGPRYGADIEVQSIEPVADEMEDSAELARADFLKEFGFKPRTNTQLLKTSKRNPLKIRKNEHGEFVVHPRGKVDTPGTHYTDSIQDARDTAASMLKKDRAQMKARGKAALSKMVDRMETGSGNRPDLTMNSRPAWTFSAAGNSIHEFAHPIGKRMKFRVTDGLGSFGQTKVSSGTHYISGRELLKAGVPKKDLRGAVKMRAVFSKRGERNVMGTQDNVWPGSDIEISGKRIDRRNGVDIGYASSEATKDLSAAGRLHEFMGERDRDDAGRFSTGQVAKPEDFMLAQKKKTGLVKKAAAATAITSAGAGLLALKYRKRI